VTVSVCIVNWNTREDLRLALRSLEQHRLPAEEMEVLVWDNASSDGSAEMVRREFAPALGGLTASEKNVGYARANNALLAQASGEFVLLMNPDVQVLPGTVQTLLAKARQDERTGGVACRLRYPDGRLQYSVRNFPSAALILWEALGLARLFPRSRTFGAYRMTWWDYGDEREVDQPMASLLLLRKRAVQQVGGFDEQFPLFFNDVDLCYRLKQAGWRILFTPQAEAIHRVAASTSQQRAQSVAASHEGLIRFFRKHYSARYGPVTMALLVGLIRVSGWARVLAACPWVVARAGKTAGEGM